MTQERPERGSVWRLLGPPSEQTGSVNDPRTHREHGVEWNEKWTYLADPGGEVLRVVLWNRYDLMGIFRVKPDGSAEPAPLQGWPESGAKPAT